MTETHRPLFYVADWLPPDFGAVGQYAVLFATQLAEAGRSVCLVGLSTGSSSIQRQEFATGGNLEIHRLFISRYDKSRNLGRLVWTIRANLRLVTEVIRDDRSRRAEILFTGSPPFMLFFAMLAKVLRRAMLIYRITDFHPEVMIAELGRCPWHLGLLQSVTWFLRRRVDAFEVLGEDQRRLLIAGGVQSERICLKRDVAPVPIRVVETELQRPPQVFGRRVLLYSGNYGVAHEVDTVVEGLIQHHRRGSGRFALWLNASGRNAERVSQRLEMAGVPFARTGPVPLDQLSALLAAADVHLIALKPGFAGIVLPSKVYGCIASRRPVLYVGPASSDVHLLCTQSNLVYEHVEPGDLAAFAGALERLASDPAASADAVNDCGICESEVPTMQAEDSRAPSL